MLLNEFTRIRADISLDSIGDSFMEDQSISLDEIEREFDWVRNIEEYAEAAEWLDQVYGDSLTEDIYLVPEGLSYFHCNMFVHTLRHEKYEGSAESDLFHFTRHSVVVFSDHEDYPDITEEHAEQALQDLDMELDERLEHHMI